MDVKKPRTFHTRVVYNSKFKSVSRNEANKNIGKNVQHIGKKKRVKSETLGKLAKVQTAPKQKCNMVQGVYYNVPVINRFDTLDVQDNVSVNTCDNVFDNIYDNVSKQTPKIQSKDTSGEIQKNTGKQRQTTNKGECIQYTVAAGNCNVVDKVVMRNVDQSLQNKQITNISAVQSSELHSVDSLNSNCTSGYTEPYLGREVPWEVVQQQSNAGSDILPVWDCKIAKQMKLQEAAAVPIFSKMEKSKQICFWIYTSQSLSGGKTFGT